MVRLNYFLVFIGMDIRKMTWVLLVRNSLLGLYNGSFSNIISVP